MDHKNDQKDPNYCIRMDNSAKNDKEQQQKKKDCLDMKYKYKVFSIIEFPSDIK